jgi:cation/acetate symporter
MYRRVAALFTFAFLGFAVVLALLGQFGLPDAVIGTLLGGATLATFLFVGLNSGTMEISEFHLAGRSVSAAANGMASAAATIGGALYLGLAGTIMADIWTGAALTAGWALGCLILAVGVAPYFRKSAAFGVADFLGMRFDSAPVRIAATVVVLVALTAALAAALATGAFVTALLFGIPEGAALVIVGAVVLVTSALGGMRAITLTAIVQYIILAVAFVVPVAIASFADFRLPIPQLTFGFALDEVSRLESVRGNLAPSLPGIFLSLGAEGAGALFATILSVAAGVAALPHLIIRTATVTAPNDARRSAGWTLFFILVVALTAPAYAAFTHLTIVRDLAGTGLEMLPPWVFSWGNLGLATVCDVDATSAIDVIEACRQFPAFTGNLAAGDIRLSQDALVLAAPDILDLPYVASALISAGAIAATIAAASAIVFALASAIGHDVYGGVINVRASAGRQLIVTRVVMAAFLFGAGWLATARPDDAYGFALAALSLSAGGLLPALILAVWWKRANAQGALAGIGVGFLVTAAMVVEYRYPGLLTLGPLNPARLGLNEVTAAMVGAPIGFATTALVSLATAPPSAEDAALVDAIRRPGGTPFVQEIESR